MTRSLLLGVLPALLVAGLAAGSSPTTPAVTPAQVKAMQALIPNCEIGCTAVGGYATAGDATKIANAISKTARSPLEAAEEAVFAAFESGNRETIVSPDGRDWGAWQLRDAGPKAFDSVRAARMWIGAADASRALCASNPAAEQLAALVSGSCDHGREKARHRNDIARDISR